MSTPEILYIDIETSPNVAHVWGLFKQNVGLNQLLEVTEMISFGAKWRGEDHIGFFSLHEDSKRGMVEAAHRFLDQADMVVHFNGRTFDVPHLNREFLLAGLKPPSPYKQVDLLAAVKKQFRFASNKLAHVSTQLGLAGKVQHEGHELWIKCMAGDPDAWARMEEYNKQDVQLLEEMHDILLPWLPGYPNVALYDPENDGELRCPGCASSCLQKRGFAYTAVSKFQQYRCNDCGKWFRDGRRIGKAEGRNIAG